MIVKLVDERKPSYFSSPNFFVRFLLPPKCQVLVSTLTVGLNLEDTGLGGKGGERGGQ